MATDLAQFITCDIVNDLYLDQLTTWMNEALRYFMEHQVTPHITVDLLKFTARARLAISTACHLLCVRFLTNEVDNEASQEALKRFFPRLMNFIDLGKNSEMHMFVLRQILHNYGYRELQEVEMRSEYHWLTLEEDQANQQVQITFVCICKV